MTKLNQIYKCNICGNIVEIVHSGAGQLVCCSKPMQLMAEKNQDIGLEKHIPVIEKTANGIKVKVGSILHPMEEKHYIEWIEIIVNNKVERKHLKPKDLPETEYNISNTNNIQARIFCNIHGLWRSN